MNNGGTIFALAFGGLLIYFLARSLATPAAYINESIAPINTGAGQ